MHTQQTILALIERSDLAVKRAIKALAPEGFDGPDAEFLADIWAKLPRYDDRMTPPQYRRARKALRGYVDRLAAIANASMAASPQEPTTDEEPGAACRWEWGSW